MNKTTKLIGKRRRIPAICGLGLAIAALGLAPAPDARATNPIWINPLTCGQPIASYYLGDSLGSPWHVNFEIGQPSWNYAQVGYGTAANGTGYNWGVANWYEDGEGSNKRVRRDIGGLKFTSTGNWYLICQANESGPDTYTSASACGWTDSTTYPPSSMAYFTVNALNDPSGQDATAASASQIDLAWSKDAQGHNVMIVRKRSSDSWTEPTQGTAYAVGNAIGSGTVVYNGSGTAYTNTGLSAGTTYDYKFYSENYSYYSAGATDSATTPKLDQTIDFPAIGNQLSTNVVALSATATSGLDVEFAVGSGPGSIDGTTLTFTGAGSVSIVASQPGNGTYNAAPEITNTFDVAEPDLAIVLSQTNVNVRENGEGRFFVRLNKNPGANLAAAVSRTAGDASVFIQAGTNWGFNSGNWSTWQPVTLAQADDANADSEAATFQIAVTGLDPAAVEAATLDDDVGDNLALASGGASASSTYPCRAGQLIDGLHNVRTNYGYVVCTSVPPGTITVDLKVTSTVSRVRILTWDWVLLQHRYRIDSSLDGSAWSTLVDASGEDHHGWEDWDAGDVSARFLRFHGVSSTQSKDAVAVAELEVYGTPALQELIEVSKTAVNVREAGEGRFFVRLTQDPGASTAVTVERTAGSASIGLQSRTNWTFNAANWNIWQPVTLEQAADGNADNEEATFQVAMLGSEPRTVTATALDDDVGDNLALASGGSSIAGIYSSRAPLLIDGIHVVSTNYGHALTSTTPKGTMTIDLKAAATVSRVRVLTWDWVNLGHRYTLESSTDGVTWSPLADATGADRNGWDDWAVADVQMRYVRFTAEATTQSQDALSVAELEVYGSRPLPELIQLSKSAVNVREGGEGRFFVRLTQNPGASVPVGLSRTAGDAGITIQSRTNWTFNAANWNVWQPVTLAAAADEDADGETATIQIAMAGSAAATVTATALDDEIGENLALASGGATIAGLSASRPGLLIDGIHAASTNYGHTVWSAVPPGTMTLDLKAGMSVSRVRLLNWDWSYRAHRYTIESSADGVTWDPLVDASGSEQSGWDDWTVSAENVRYLRFTGVSNTVNQCVVVSELEVYGTRPPIRRSAVSGRLSGTAVAGVAVVESEPVAVLTSDGPEDETGWNALDGDDATAWVGQKAGGGYLVVEYQPTLTLAGLEVDVTEASLAAAQVLTSLDGQDWQPLPEDLETDPVALNFLWLVFPDDGTAAVPEVIEIRPNP